ncbi:MAG: FkbM family methyltransferase [Paracoccaceae bacterium]
MIRQIAHHITRRHLTRLNQQHLGQFPQVACFSFDLITHFIHMDGRYEKDELDYLARHVFPQLPAGGICLDVGANIGNHSLTFAPHFARVIGFEPHPRTFRLLQLNAELAPNVTALNLGASSAPGVISVGQDPQNMAATGIGRDGVASMARVDFQLVRIDDLAEVQEAGPVTFMKVDVEGHEAQALEGASDTIRRHAPLIALEVLRDDVENGETAALRVLRGLGYTHFYELREKGRLGRLSRRPKRLARTLLTLFTGRRPSKAGTLARVERLEDRAYLMLLCATQPIAGAEQR